MKIKIISLVCLSITLLVLMVYICGYALGVSDTHKEAFDNGLMVKEITKDDKVIYRWIHTEKLGYE